MTKPKLTVIKGGMAAPKEHNKKYFISAYVTDTRLMGVIVVYIHWRLPSQFATPDFHQFFYFDVEEFGFENYKSLLGDDVDELCLIEQALINGLGGKKVEITKREASHLIYQYSQFNLEKNIPLPSGLPEYQFLIENPTTFTQEEKEILMEKQCAKILSDFQTINYFLMRSFGKDLAGAAYLAVNDCPLDIYPKYPCATLCKNTIDEIGDGTYLCESLIDYDDRYSIVVSQLRVDDLRVTEFKPCSGFNVSSSEAAMMLSRPEFVTVYELLLTPEDFDNNIEELTRNSMMTTHENGKLFLAFHGNNDHTNKSTFRLSEDVLGLYYVTDFGQLILGAYTMADIHMLERDLRKSSLAPFLVPAYKYEFKEPIVFEFVQSDFEDFNDFLDFIKDE
ncbi:MAG: hypothetical protein RSD88_07085 [Anaerovoracaceae bacterium]